MQKILRGFIIFIITIFMLIVLEYRTNVDEMERNRIETEELASDFKSRMGNVSNKMYNFESISRKYPQDLVKELKKIGKEVQKIDAEMNHKEKLGLTDKKEFKKNIEQLEQKYTKQAEALFMIEGNNRQLYRNSRIQLLTKISTDSDISWMFGPVYIKNPWILAGNNLHSPYFDKIQKRIIDKELIVEEKRFQQSYAIQTLAKQLPFCIVLMTKNNAQNWRFQYNLQSILNQDYKNYKLVIVDLGSRDGTPELMMNFLTRQGKPKISYLFLHMKESDNTMQTFYRTIHDKCGHDDIVVPIDGSDQLLGNKVFKVLNSKFLKTNVSMIYSNYFKGQPKNDTYVPVRVQGYWKTAEFRRKREDAGPFITFRHSYFRKIHQYSFKDENGQWLDINMRESWVYPLFQLCTCDQWHYLQEYPYLINYGFDQHPYQDQEQAKAAQQVIEFIKNQPKYDCFNQQRQID